MEKLKFITLIALVSILAISCSSDNSNDDVILDKTPVKIEEFVKKYFPQNTVLKVEKEKSDNSYDVTLSGAIELDFNSRMEVTKIELPKTSTTGIPTELIHSNISKYVKSNYPNTLIIGWKKELNYQEVTLNNGVELEFTLEGNFIRIDV